MNAPLISREKSFIYKINPSISADCICFMRHVGLPVLIYGKNIGTAYLFHTKMNSLKSVYMRKTWQYPYLMNLSALWAITLWINNAICQFFWWMIFLILHKLGCRIFNLTFYLFWALTGLASYLEGLLHWFNA